jgi:hypothetical protein
MVVFSQNAQITDTEIVLELTEKVSEVSETLGDLPEMVEDR